MNKLDDIDKHCTWKSMNGIYSSNNTKSNHYEIESILILFVGLHQLWTNKVQQILDVL